MDHGHIMHIVQMLGQLNLNGTKFVLSGMFSGLMLTQKQMLILVYLILGYSAPEIAAVMHRSPRTIEGHIEELKMKLRCDSKKELVCRVVTSLFRPLPENPV